jgi:ribonuclease D
VVARLREKDLLVYCQEDSLLMLKEGAPIPYLKTLYQQFSNAWQFDRRQLLLLKNLAMWREASARLHDIPRAFVLKNHTLLAMVQKRPYTLAQLSRIEDLHPRTYQKHGPMLLEMIKAARHQPIEQCPPLLPLPLPKSAKSLFDLLRQKTDQIAQQHHIPADVLLRKRWLDALVLGYIDEGDNFTLPLALQGWRYEILTKPLLEILASQAQQLLKWRQYRHRLDDSVEPVFN